MICVLMNLKLVKKKFATISTMFSGNWRWIKQSWIVAWIFYLLSLCIDLSKVNISIEALGKVDERGIFNCFRLFGFYVDVIQSVQIIHSINFNENYIFFNYSMQEVKMRHVLWFLLINTFYRGKYWKAKSFWNEVKSDNVR